MAHKFIFFIFLILYASIGFAQQLPLNTCGIVNTYDAVGNRLRRLYFCNNGVDPYPMRVSTEVLPTTSKPNGTGGNPPTSSKSGSQHGLDPRTTQEFEVVDALYPNPTTGKFSVTFSKALQNAAITVTDVHGKIILRFIASGYKVDFNLSSFASGTYFVKINNSGNIISKKVVKQ